MKHVGSLSAVLLLVLWLLAACGGKPAAIGDLPVLPGATELKAGESRVGDTLAKNMQQNAALRQAMGSGGKTEQRGFLLPAEATWEKVKDFYDGELKAAGWSSGLGGVAGDFVDVNAVLNTANKDNDLFKTAIWSKDKQTLTVVMVRSTTGKAANELILSLSTR